MEVKNIVVVPYNPKWTADFNKIKTELEEVISDIIIRMEHVGSTSVRGLPAKPIIDIDVVIKDYSVFDDIVKRLASIGYIYEGDLGIEGREAFRYDNKPHLQEHHLYVCPEQSRELHRHITFRNYLRMHPEAVEKYGRIKLEAAKLYPNDIEKYLEYKCPVIQEIYRLCGLIWANLISRKLYSFVFCFS